MPLADPVRQLVAIEAIKVLKARYFRYIDTKDWEGLRQLFTENAQFDLGPHGRYDGRDAFLVMAKAKLSDETTIHHGHMPEIELTGTTTARGVWTMFDYLDGPHRRVAGYGYYEEEYRELSGQWKIARLRLTRVRVDRLDESAAKPR